MPTRNDQEYEKRRQQIIDGALDVFSGKGFEKATNRDIAALIFDQGLQGVLCFSREYFARQMPQGNIRQADPEAVAYSFVGSLLAYTFLDIFSDTPNAATHERMVAATVEIFLRPATVTVISALYPLDMRFPNFPGRPPSKSGIIGRNCNNMCGHSN